jgi:signal peptidase I
MRFSDWENLLVAKTQALLTWRKRRKLRKKEKQKRKNQILDWIEALLWAAVVVLLINQYFLQGYAVPTGSMEDTILGEDRIFVNKLVYGPEIIPGWGKLPGAAPQRGEIIVFPSPTYKSDFRKEYNRDISGFEELFNRLVYMITFTLVNPDKKKNGEPLVHFLVKRLIGLPGEQLRLRDGRVEIKRVCEDVWTPEEDLKNAYIPLAYNQNKKFFLYDKYDLIKRYVVNQNLKLMKLPSDPKLSEIETEYRKIAVLPRSDEFFEDYWRTSIRISVRPFDRAMRSLYERRALGWYIPEGRFFPMGDNRDNSRDARYFGSVKVDDLLGRALFRFWPLHRFGAIN